MANPLPAAFLEDPLLMAIDALPASKLLTQAQVCLLLECTPRWLEEQRSRGGPPPYVQLGDGMVRYAVGPLREWLARTISDAPTSPLEQRKRVAAETLGYDEPALRGGRRKKTGAESFGQFVALARTGDEWPFVLRAPFGRPVDFIIALAMDLTDDDTSDWLTLAHYADRLQRSVDSEAASVSAQGVADELRDKVFSAGEPRRL